MKFIKIIDINGTRILINIEKILAIKEDVQYSTKETKIKCNEIICSSNGYIYTTESIESIVYKLNTTNLGV